MSGEDFSLRKALGSAANGAVTGAVRGAIVGSGAGIGLAMLSNFAGGAAGNALKQFVGKGTVDFGDSVVSGLTNMVSGAIYGRTPIKNFGKAIFKGAASGAATAGINNLYGAWKNRNNSQDIYGAKTRMGRRVGYTGLMPYGWSRDPRAGCGTSNPLRGGIGFRTVRGYRYVSGESQGRKQTRSSGFRPESLIKDVLIGSVMGGLGGAAFYGADKAMTALRGSFGKRGGTQTVNRPSARTQINNLPETKSPNAIKASEVTNAWDDYLGSNTTNAHPITGQPDPNRIFSSDATRSIRLGNHEMKSFGTTKAHFHYEKWDYNAADDIMNISNIMQRFRG